MAPARSSVLALLSLAASIAALPAGLQDRQIEILPPKQSVSFENGNPEPTAEPSGGLELPPIFPPKPTDQISLGTASGWVSWETDAPGPTPTSEEPDYPPPGKPSDQISLGTPSYWVSWDTGAPVATPTSERPEFPAPGKPSDQISLGTPSYWISWETEGPVATPTPSVPVSSSVSKPTTTKKPGYPEYSPWKPWPPKPHKSSSTKVSTVPKSTPKASSTPKPTPIPSPIPTSVPQQSNEISLGQPSGYISWDWDKMKREENGYAPPKPTPPPKPTSKKLASSSKKPQTSSKKPTSSSKQPLPSSKKGTPTPTPKPTPTPSPQPSPKPTPKPTPSPSPIPDDDEEPLPGDDDPEPQPPQQSDEITIGKPSGFLSWGKREAAPTEAPPPFPWPTQPSAIVIWSKRQVDSDDPEDPDDEFPEDPTDPDGPIEIPPVPVPTQPNTVTLGQPTATVIWGKRQDEPEPEETEGPIDIPPVPAPTQPNTIGLDQPVATVIWGKRQDATPTLGAPDSTVIWGFDALPVPKPTPACQTSTVTVRPTSCVPPTCPPRATPCDLNKPVPRMEKVVKAPGVPCTAATATLVVPCPTYTCVPGCEAGRVVR